MSCVVAVVVASALACGCSDEGRAQSFEGPWVRHAIDTSGRGADGVRIADLNGDGLPDVTSGWEGDGVTRAYLHPGHEEDHVRHPWPAVTVGVTPHVEDAVWADVDDDGTLDVVSSSEGSTQVVFVSFAPCDPDDFLDPDAWITEPIPATQGRHWMYAAPIDADGKNGIDLVVGAKGGNAILGWLESPEDPRDLAAWKLHEISDVGWVMSIDVHDMNGDGYDDLLVSDRKSSPVNGVHWFEHPGDGDVTEPWTNHLIGAEHRSPTFIDAVLNDDGEPSGVIVPSGSERLTLFERENPEANLWSEVPLAYPHRLGTPKSAAVGDIDLDGVPDVVVATTNLSGWKEGIVWLSKAAVPGSEPVKHGISGAQGQKFDRTELVDLDGDGDLDVLTTEEIEDLGVIWYENPLLPPAPAPAE
jgi:hypothetical protein